MTLLRASRKARVDEKPRVWRQKKKARVDEKPRVWRQKKKARVDEKPRVWRQKKKARVDEKPRVWRRTAAVFGLSTNIQLTYNKSKEIKGRNSTTLSGRHKNPIGRGTPWEQLTWLTCPI